MKINVKHLHLSPSAAMFMDTHRLVMRNSYTEQTESLHYGRSNFSGTSGNGAGQYCTPLWTIARPNLLVDIETDVIRGHISPNELKARYASINMLDHVDTASIIECFVDKVRKAICFHTSFGHLFNYFYNYELLIAAPNDYDIDDLGQYPTGGRSQNFNGGPIIYRATFNEVEIKFFKHMLDGALDQLIYKHGVGAQALQEIVLRSLRITLCNQLATEIITSKLIIFLNACGQLKTVISFSESDLHALLEKIVSQSQNKIEDIVKNQLIHVIANNDDFYDAYKSANKYTHARFKSYDDLSICVPQKKAAARCKKIVAHHRHLSEIDQTLEMLKRNIGNIDHHHSPEALEKAQQLLSALQAAWEQYKSDLNKSRVDAPKARDRFKTYCREAINTAKPILEKDLSWGDYLNNILKIMLNQVINVLTLGYYNSFFTYKRSDAIENVAGLQQLLALGSSPEPL